MQCSAPFSFRPPWCVDIMAGNMSNEELASVFGEYLPALQATQGPGQSTAATPNEQTSPAPPGPPTKWPRHNGKGQGHGHWKDTSRATSWRGWQETTNKDGNEELIQILAQICLRQEDSLNLLRLDRAFLMSFRTQGPETMLGTLYGISTKWKSQRDSGQTDCPLRIALFKCIALELKTRVSRVAESSEKLAVLAKQGWVLQEAGKELCWTVLVWNQAEQKDVTSTETGPLPHTDAIKAFGRHHPPTLPFNPASLSVLQGRDGTVPTGNLEQGGCTAESASCPLRAVQFVDLVHGGGQATCRNTAQISSGSEVAKARLQQVATLTLQNPHNVCYQHAFICSWAWTMLQHVTVQGPPRIDLNLVGNGAVLLTQLLDAQPSRLVHLPAWVSLMRHWRRPQEQHDAGEFASHALKHLCPASMQGRWVARIADPLPRDVDTGPLLQPLPLPIPKRATTVQECVEAWHGQAAVHGLEAPTPVVLLQLGRFTGGRARARKHHHRLDVSRGLRLPFFRGGLDTQWCHYSVVAGVYHLGRTASSGHYRSFLINAGDGAYSNDCEPLRYSFPGHTLSTDDGRSALPVTSEDTECILRNTYLLWCIQSS